MASSLFQLTKDYWRKWQLEKPIWMVWVIIVSLMIIYILLVLIPLGIVTTNKKEAVAAAQTQLTWLIRAGSEITRLRQNTAQVIKENTVPPFTIINQQINSLGWGHLVSDLHQGQENQVELTFSSISFNLLHGWLETLANEYGITVEEATLEKTGPGMVRASLLLQGNLSDGKTYHAD